MDFTGSGLLEELIKRSHELGDITIAAERMDMIKAEILEYQQRREMTGFSMWRDIAYAKLGRIRDKMKPEEVEAVQNFLEREL